MNWIKRLFGIQEPSAVEQSPLSVQPQVPLQTAVSSESDPQSTTEELVVRYGHLYRPALQLLPGSNGEFSRLGGLPRMPDSLIWPEWKGKPLAFLAQLSLAELHAVLPSFLPASGFLFFFYDQEQGAWGFDPNDLGSWQVHFTRDDCTGLAERAAPAGLPPESIFNAKPVVPRRIDVLPDSQQLTAPEFDWKRDGDAYSELRGESFVNADRHQVLGYPTPVQGDDMEEECQLASHGIFVGNAEGYKDPRVPALKEGIKDWKLLLQLDSDDDAGWMWGDSGMLYFWVREQDVKAGDFSRVWMVLQCC